MHGQTPGEFLAAWAASPIYELYGKVGTDEMPTVNTPFHGTVGYHLRDGKHDVTDYDWAQYIKFADQHFESISQWCFPPIFIGKIFWIKLKRPAFFDL